MGFLSGLFGGSNAATTAQELGTILSQLSALQSKAQDKQDAAAQAMQTHADAIAEHGKVVDAIKRIFATFQSGGGAA